MVEGGLVGVEELLMLVSLVEFIVVATWLPMGLKMNVGQGSMCELMVNSWEVEVLLPFVVLVLFRFEEINVVWMPVVNVGSTSW